MTLRTLFTLALAAFLLPDPPPEPPLSRQVAATILATYPNGRGDTWNYEEGTLLMGLEELWSTSHDDAYLRYIQHCVDRFVAEDGSIRTYKAEDQSLDNILMGRQLLFLANVTGNPKYTSAAGVLYRQLQQQPRTREGGFWHKKRYPEQMWLDGLYMAEPFYAESSIRFHHPENFADILLQFRLLEDHTRDPRTGLLFHGWDSSRLQAWADRRTGASPSLWSRAMGWYGLALVDTLDFVPPQHPAHAALVAMLGRFAHAIVAAQDSNGVWFQIADKPAAKGNYEESSASAMFVYVLAKGVRKGWLPESYNAPANRGFLGLRKFFISTDAQGTLHFKGTTDAVGLGGTPYRDGSFSYYTSVPQVTDDARGLGALLLAATEAEHPKSR